MGTSLLNRIRKLPAALLAYFGIGVIGSIILWKRMLFFDGTYYWTNSTNIWGDWSLHFVYIYNFLHRHFPLSYFPIYWGHPFRYHFAADALTAFIMRSGIPLTHAVVIPSIILSILILYVCFLFYWKVFRSRFTALFAPLVFLFNGGLGYFITHADSDYYSRIDSMNIMWMNFIIAELIPQRAFLLGLPIAILLLLFFWKVYAEPNRIKPPIFFISGTVCGLMMLIHWHSYYVLLLFAAYVCMLTIKKTMLKKWAYFIIPLAALSSFLWIKCIGNIPIQLISYNPGWYAPSGVFSFIKFWIMNIGIMAILIPISYTVIPKRILIFGSPFLILFVLSNILSFQKEPWDNRKFFLYWYFFSAGTVSYLIDKIFRYKKFIGYLLILLIYYTSIVSGLFDVIKHPFGQNQLHRLFSVKDMAFAETIRQSTDSESVFLAYPANSWLGMVLGRQVVMGFDLWLPNYGIDTNKRKKDIETI